MSQDTQEIWKHIQGYESSYAVSNRGRVMNLKKNKVLKPIVDGAGYVYVNLRQKKHRLHRLVAQAFLGNPENLPQVNHIDEDPTNNDVSNLEWCTASHNAKHSIHKQTRKINQLTLDGEFVKQWESSYEIERELGYAHNNIIACCKGKHKTNYGYRWQYADGLHQRRVNRPVVALTKDGEFVAEYKSAAEASRCLGASDSFIYKILKGKFETIHGYRFLYADDYYNNFL